MHTAATSRFLISAIKLSWVASLFLLATGSSAPATFDGAASEHPNCTRDYRDIMAKCVANGNELSGVCNTKSDPNDGCKKTVTCTRPQGDWSATDACTAFCWATIRPFNWYFSDNIEASFGETVDVEITSTQTDGKDGDLRSWKGVRPNIYLDKSERVLGKFDLLQMKSFSIVTTVYKCEQ